MSIRMHVANIMASVDTGVDIDISKLEALKHRRGKQSAKKDSITFSLPEHMATIQIFPSGKAVITSSVYDGLSEAYRILLGDLLSIGYDVGEPEMVVNNIVASGDFRRTLELTRISLHLGLERTEYEPEQFPGLIYRLAKPPATVLLFSTGKMVCTGVSSPEEISSVADSVSRSISEVC